MLSPDKGVRAAKKVGNPWFEPSWYWPVFVKREVCEIFGGSLRSNAYRWLVDTEI